MVNKARCPKCNQEITKSDKFCSNCGAQVTPSQNSNHKNANFKQRKFICKNCKKDIPILDNNETKILCPYCGKINLRKSSTGRISTIMKTTILIFIVIIVISLLTSNKSAENSSLNGNNPTSNNAIKNNTTLESVNNKNIKPLSTNGNTENNTNNAPSKAFTSSSLEETYNKIKNTTEFKAYVDFIDEIYSDKLYGNIPFADTSGDKELFEQLKPKYTQIVNKKYNIDFDIDNFENKFPNHEKLLQYHRETENIIRNAYLKEQYETLKSNQLFHAYIVEYPKLVSSQLPEIDSEIERQLGKPPIDQTKNKKYIEEYQKLDKYLWNLARINCAKQISKKYNLKFNINEIEQQNPEWKEISTWYSNEQYKLNEEAKEQALEEFNKQFSGWDGSNRYVEKAIKSLLNAPSSYEHHQTFRYINENSNNKKLHVITRFKAKNGFGALMMNRAECDIDLSGNISNLKIQPGF